MGRVQETDPAVLDKIKAVVEHTTAQYDKLPPWVRAIIAEHGPASVPHLCARGVDLLLARRVVSYCFDPPRRSA
jgi:hypothetical protein